MSFKLNDPLTARLQEYTSSKGHELHIIAKPKDTRSFTNTQMEGGLDIDYVLKYLKNTQQVLAAEDRSR